MDELQRYIQLLEQVISQSSEVAGLIAAQQAEQDRWLGLYNLLFGFLLFLFVFLLYFDDIFYIYDKWRDWYANKK